MENQVLLSIIIPTYNRNNRLNALLQEIKESIIEGKFNNIVEIIIIDDASIPPIHIKNIPCKIQLKKNKKNRGAPYSREKGFHLSVGKFIHFHDSDDSITKSWLKELITALNNKPSTDLLLTGRIDRTHNKEITTYKRYFHQHIHEPEKVAKRLLYWNCIGPIGGVIFSREILKKIPFKHFSSSQDWQMYLNAMEHKPILNSQPEIKFLFNKTGSDRISHSPRKKILGFLQYAYLTEKKSLFNRNIRLFYLYRCRKHIFEQQGLILQFYKKHRLRIFLIHLVIAGYSFLVT